MHDIRSVYVVSRSPVMAGLNRADIDRFLAGARKASFVTGEHVVEQGKLETQFCFILSGRLKVVITPKSAMSRGPAGSIRVNELKEGDYYGDHGLIDGAASFASIIAQTPGELVAIPFPQMKAVLDADDRLSRIVYGNLLRQLLGRLRRKEQEYDLSLLYD